MHLLTLIDEAATKFPEQDAIRWGDDRVTYAQLQQQIASVAGNAIRAGAKPGERFLYAAKPNVDSLVVTLGLLRAGLTLVFVDPFSAPDLFNARARLVEASFVVADSLLYLVGHRRLARLRAWRNLNICDYSTVDTAKHWFVGSWLPGLPKGATGVSAWRHGAVDTTIVLPKLDGNADAIIVFTSGTTGDPKGVVHSLATLSANATGFASRFSLQPGEIVYSEPMTLGVVALATGATWVIPKKGEEIPEEVGVLFAVPTEVLQHLDNAESQKKPPRVRVLGTGGAPVLPSLIKRIGAVLGSETLVLAVYGMTEMLPVAVATGEEKLSYSLSGDLLGEHIGDTKVRISADREIEVAGSGLMTRYFGREPSVWHPTGDLGRLDADGRIVMLGRKKNMLIRGNMNIYPSLYEPGITKISGVADAVIVGVPNEYGDDRVVLFVIPADKGADEHRLQLLVEKEIVHHMDVAALPDLIRVIKSMPVSGRSLKRNMTELAALAKALFPDEAATHESIQGKSQ